MKLGEYGSTKLYFQMVAAWCVMAAIGSLLIIFVPWHP